MTPARERLSALIVVMVSILLALGLAGLVYYYKIKQNEDYQNQLHFRELKLMIDAFDKGVDQVISAAFLQNDRAEVQDFNREPFEIVRKPAELLAKEIAALVQLNSELEQAETEIFEVDELIYQIEGQQDAQSTRSQEQLAVGDQVVELELKLSSNRDTLYQLQEGFEVYWTTPLIDLLFTNDSEFDRRFGEICNESPESICNWLDDIEFKVLAPETYADVARENVPAELSRRIEQRLKVGNTILASAARDLAQLETEAQALKKIRERLSNLVPAGENVSPKQLCKEIPSSLASVCSDLSYIAAQEFQPTRQMKGYESWADQLSSLQRTNAASVKFYSTYISVLEKVIEQVNNYGSDETILNQIQGIKALAAEIEKDRQKLFELQSTGRAQSQETRGNQETENKLLAQLNSDWDALGETIYELESRIGEARLQANRANAELYRACNSAWKYTAPNAPAEGGANYVPRILSACRQYVTCTQEIIDFRATQLGSCHADTLLNNLEDAWEFRFGSRLLSTLFQSSDVLQNARILPSGDCWYFTDKEDGHIRFVKGASPGCGFGNSWHAVYRVDDSSHLAVPLGDLMRAELERFPLVLLVDSEGELVLRRENVTIDAFQNGLEFENVKPLLRNLLASIESGESEDPKSTGEASSQNEGYKAGISGTIKMTLAGENFRLFISPYRNEKVSQTVFSGGDTSERDGEFYLIGFKSQSQLQSDKLAISNSMVLAGVLLVAGVVVVLPLLKIRLVSAQQAYTRTDIFAAHFGMLLLSGVFTIAIADLWIYEHTKSGIEARAKRIVNQVQGAFAAEIGHLREYAREHSLGTANGATINPGARFRDYYFGGVKEINGSHSGAPIDPPYYFLENLFTLEGTGSNAGRIDGEAYWSSFKLARTGGAPNVSKRGYFKRARDCDLWYPWESEPTDCGGIYIERLFNLRDGRRTTQFSEPLPDTLDGEAYDVLSYGTMLQTFMSPVLPPNYGFIVFENSTGNVMYHSDDDRSLVENFYVETDSDPGLLSIVRHWRPGAPMQHRTATYRGKSHLMTMGALHPGVPWTLIVYYQKDELRSVNLALAVVSLLILLALAVLFALLFLRAKNPQLPLLGERIESDQRGTPESLAGFTRGYLLTLLAFNVLLLSVVLIFVNITDTRYEAYLRGHIAESAMAADIARKDYRDFFVDYAGLNIAPSHDAEYVACYIGSEDATLTPAHTEQCAVEHALAMETQHTKDQGLHAAMPFSGLINLLFRHKSLLPLENDYAADFRIGPEYFPDGNISGTFWRAVSVLTLLVVALWCLYYLCRAWIGKRLLGLDVPRQFRVRDADSNAPEEAEIDPLFSSDPNDRFVAVIRPNREFITACSSKTFASKYGTLLTEKPIHCMELLQIADAEKTEEKPRKTPTQTLQALLAKRELTGDDKDTDVLVIKGLESTSMAPSSRIYLLEFLEHVMNRPGTRIILLCEIAPLYRMIYQDQYPHRDDEEVAASSAEVVRWSDVLRRFRKVYDWTPTEKPALGETEDTLQTLLYEARGWPEFEDIWKEFWIYCSEDESLREEGKTPALWYGDKTDALDKAFSDHLERWKPQQVIEFFGAHAGPFYRFRWEICTRAERLMLYQLAMGQQPNPENLEPLEHLARRGYIFYDKGWHIINESFARFVKTAESPQVFAHWINEACESTWKYLKLPLFAVVLALLAIVVYSATDALESALAILTGILGLIPLALRSFAMFRGTPTDS